MRIGATNIKAQAYKSLVCTVLEYSCTVWDPAAQKDIDRLEAVQRRAARFALNQHQRMASAKLMLQELNWPSLEHHEGQHNLACCVKSTVASQQSSANSSSSSPREPGIPTPQLSRGYPLVCFCSWSLFFSLFFLRVLHNANAHLRPLFYGTFSGSNLSFQLYISLQICSKDIFSRPSSLLFLTL